MSDLEKLRPRGPAPAPSNGLPEHRQKQVEAGLATYQSVLAERDMLDRQLRDALAKIEGMNVQLSAIQGVVNMMESTMQTCQLQRDEAVTKAATLETTLRNAVLLMTSEMYDEKRDGDAVDHPSPP